MMVVLLMAKSGAPLCAQGRSLQHALVFRGLSVNLINSAVTARALSVREQLAHNEANRVEPVLSRFEQPVKPSAWIT